MSDASQKSFLMLFALNVDAELEAMEKYVVDHGGTMVKVQQRPGDKVFVPAGWMHIVINKKVRDVVALHRMFESYHR